MRHDDDYSLYLQENISLLRAFQLDNVTAWLSPKGHVFITPLFEHLAFFLDNRHYIPHLSSFLLARQNENGKLSLPSSDMSLAMDIAYSKGWGRLGSFGGDKLELDCSTEYVRHLSKFARSIGKLSQRKFVCNVTQPGQNPRRGVRQLRRSDYMTALRDGLRAWISPSGVIFPSSDTGGSKGSPFSPFLADQDLAPEISGLLHGFLNRFKEDLIYDFQESFRDSDHMPWHLFDADVPYEPLDEETSSLNAILFELGWGRLEIKGTIGFVTCYSTDFHDALTKVEEALKKSGCSLEILFDQKLKSIDLPSFI